MSISGHVIHMPQRLELRTSIVQLTKQYIDAFTAAEDVERCSEDIVSLVADALAEVKRGWNSKSHAVNMLPAEILTECFSWLDLPQRFTATRVSSTWRATALPSRRLWAHANIDAYNSTKRQMLKTAIARAGAHPLDISLHAVSTFAGIFDGIFYDISEEQRLRTLEMQYSRAVRLRVNELKLPGCSFLTTLRLDRFTMRGVTEPFLLLRHLRGTVLNEDFDHLLQLCPALTDLAITGNFCESELPTERFASLPSSITQLSLLVTNDVSRYLKSWTAPLLLSLTLTGSETIEWALKESSHFEFPYKTLILGEDHVYIKPVDDFGRTVHIHDCRGGANQVLSSNLIEIIRPRLTTLTYLLLDCVDFHAVIEAQLVLPSLDQLVLGNPRWTTHPARGSLVVPVLREITLSFLPKMRRKLIYLFVSEFQDSWLRFAKPSGRRVDLLSLTIGAFYGQYRPRGQNLKFDSMAKEYSFSARFTNKDEWQRSSGEDGDSDSDGTA